MERSRKAACEENCALNAISASGQFAGSQLRHRLLQPHAIYIAVRGTPVASANLRAK